MTVFDTQLKHASVVDHNLAFFYYQRPLYLKKAAGLMTGFIGVVILLSPNIGETWSNHLAGQAAVLLAALSYGASTVFVRKMAKGLPPQTQAFLHFLSATVITWIIILAAERPLVFPQLPITWLALL